MASGIFRAGSGPDPEAWGSGVVWLHWIMAPLVLLVLVSGYGAEHWAEPGDQRLLYEIHFSLGLLSLLLVIVRLVWRAIAGAPRRPDRPFVERWAARAVHLLLYLALVSALVSGWVNFMFLGPVRVFGLFDMPRLFDPETQEPLRALSWYVHYYSYWLLLALVTLHAAAALYHHFVRRDRTLLDFLPRRRR
jgi:cytochrome b561